MRARRRRAGPSLTGAPWPAWTCSSVARLTHTPSPDALGRADPVAVLAARRWTRSPTFLSARRRAPAAQRGAWRPRPAHGGQTDRKKPDGAHLARGEPAEVAREHPAAPARADRRASLYSLLAAWSGRGRAEAPAKSVDCHGSGQRITACQTATLCHRPILGSGPVVRAALQEPLMSPASGCPLGAPFGRYRTATRSKRGGAGWGAPVRGRGRGRPAGWVGGARVRRLRPPGAPKKKRPQPLRKIVTLPPAATRRSWWVTARPNSATAPVRIRPLTDQPRA